VDRIESLARTGRDGILNDLETAEEQIARGEGVEHEVALLRVLSRIYRITGEVTADVSANADSVTL
jgi:hypothetical protein